MKPFSLLVVLWGNKFCHYFLDLLVASLLAENNLPAIAHQADHVFLIATTKPDWEFLQSDWRFKKLSELITLKFLDISAHLTDPNRGKMQVMSLGHKEISQLAYENKGIGVFLTPDMVLTKSAFVTINSILSRRYQVVLCPAVRFEYNGCMREFKERKLLSDGILSATGQELMSVVLANIHSETTTWIWDDNRYADNPVITLKRLSGKNNYVVHGYSWAPLAIDYSSLTSHDMSTFDKSTLDQDYVYKNFGTSKKIYVVYDTDELAIASFSTEEEYHIPNDPKPFQNLPYLGRLIRRDNLSRIHHCKIHDMDPLKKDLVKRSVFMHADPPNPLWKKEARLFRRRIVRSVRKKPISQYPTYVLYFNLHALMISKFRFFFNQELFVNLLCANQWHIPGIYLKQIQHFPYLKAGFRLSNTLIVKFIGTSLSLITNIILRWAVLGFYLSIMIYTLLSYSLLNCARYFFKRCFSRQYQGLAKFSEGFPTSVRAKTPHFVDTPSRAMILFRYLPRYFIYKAMDVCHAWFSSLKRKRHV